jgi:hypothetical protein
MRSGPNSGLKVVIIIFIENEGTLTIVPKGIQDQKYTA